MINSFAVHWSYCIEGNLMFQDFPRLETVRILGHRFILHACQFVIAYERLEIVDKRSYIYVYLAFST